MAYDQGTTPGTDVGGTPKCKLFSLSICAAGPGRIFELSLIWYFDP